MYEEYFTSGRDRTLMPFLLRINKLALRLGRHISPGISTVTPGHVVELLTSKDWTSDVGTLAIKIVEAQLANHEMHQEVVRAYPGVNLADRVPRLFDLCMLKIMHSIGDDPEEDMGAILALPPSVLSRAVHWLVNIPYHATRVHMERQSQTDNGDVDEWVLRNETWLREASVPVGVHHSASSSKQRRAEQGQKITQGSTPVDWTYGLIRLSSHAEVVFPDSVQTQTSRVITRPSSVSGFKVLDGRRLPVIRIQPSVDAFAQTFNKMTDGLLKGLNWDHVFIAGGIALGALLSTKDEQATNKPEQWKNSDVDLYIHGLGPLEANKKVQHIFDVFKANVPAHAPVLVVRNSKTITFFSKYPIRRIQVVLKLVRSPKDVLLNFDLDVCSVGWDGEDVWMLPRAARALETGYTVFTMDLINGHYLGDRRATQEQRVFKYADKGYGIRILPRYLDELEAMKNDPDNRHLPYIPNQRAYDAAMDAALDVKKVALEARSWTAKAVECLLAGHFVYPFSADDAPPCISHAFLQERYQITEDPPRRSCMSGLAIFMRHVALWEHETAGDITIMKDDWAAGTYDQIYASLTLIGYNDSPDYSWNEDFTIEGFIRQMSMFNQGEVSRMIQNLRMLFSVARGSNWPWTSVSDDVGEEINNCLVHGSMQSVQRISHATSVHEILQPECDIVLPLWIPETFVDFVNKLVPEKARESGIQGYNIHELAQCLKADVPSGIPDGEQALMPVLWRITNVTMWQQLDRTIDEVHEVLWSFHHANAELSFEDDVRLGLLFGQFSRRAIRKTAQHESRSFARWVSREPAFLTNYNGPLQELE